MTSCALVLVAHSNNLLRRVLNGVAAVLTHMRERNSGHIVNYSSDADRKVFPGSAVYSATKAFVTLYSQGLRDELAKEKKEARSSCPVILQS